MRKALLSLIILAISLVSFAQSETGSDQEKNSKQKYVTNGFWDNWFISAGVGGQVYFGENDDLGSFSKRITPAFNFSVGKWITPSIGFRGQISGFAAKGFTLDEENRYVRGIEDGLYKQEWDYLNIHGDILFNVLNAISGYRTDRFYEVIPYIGFGGITSLNSGSSDQEFSWNGGIINKFRISDAIDLNLELQGTLIRQSFDGEVGGRMGEGIGAALVGITYKFKNREFKKYTAPVPAAPQLISAEDLAKLRQQVAAEQARAKQAQDELNAERNKPKTTIVEKDFVAAPLAVFFAIDKAIITAKEKINLGFVADMIKQYPNEKFMIIGHADKATGNPAYNQKLSEKRAQAVVDMLVKEFGVNSNQLQAKGVGDTENSFATPTLNRVVILRQ